MTSSTPPPTTATTSAPRVRPALTHVPDYRQGPAPRPPVLGTATYKLSSNENPYPPPRAVTEAVLGHLAGMNRYPDMAAPSLVSAVARRFAVAPDEVVPGAGSVEVVTQLVRALAGPGDEVVMAWRSFEAYPLIVRGAGAEPVLVPLDRHAGHDLDAMRAAVTARTTLVLVCTPNNPTGTTVAPDALEQFVDSLPGHVTVLVDEAYLHFADGPDGSAAHTLFHDYAQVVVAHTFSKAYGLAGLRVGYALAHTQIASAMRKVAVPFGVSDLAQAAAVAALGAEDEVAAQVARIVAERGRLHTALTTRGWEIPVPHGNFLWLPTGSATSRLSDALADRGITVRAFADEGMRISIGTPAAGDALLDALDSLDAHPVGARTDGTDATAH